MRDLTQVTKALAERAEHNDRTASFPADSIAAIHDAGLLTATVHERYGGQGRRAGGDRRHPAGARPGRPFGRADQRDDDVRARLAAACPRR
jgi:alkylation response protein AidB-like acyl-CoA dehydrogenase